MSQEPEVVVHTHPKHGDRVRPGVTGVSTQAFAG